ncbi:conserved membrane hypothetical protein [Candidatus Zixiibacteriota bacterium]|nr:conserved membrane hypothetical protein [candidate division Zixibacteria bacterium]
MRGEDSRHINKLVYLFFFGAAMGFLEAAVVVYLRALYYPEGFSFPLRGMPSKIITFEIFRELATIIMLYTAAAIATRRFWERFGYFLFVFGLWDIFYYIWLKATLGWPQSIFDWDILFLIPVPWIGPVIAPVLIAILMTIVGALISSLYRRGFRLRTTLYSRLLGGAATIAILYTFMRDSGAALYQKMPQPFLYWVFLPAYLLYIIVFYYTYRRSRRHV